MSQHEDARRFSPFSVLSLDATLLFERQSYSMATSYIVGSVFASLAALLPGFARFKGVKPLP